MSGQDIIDAFNNAFRDYVTDGVPASGVYQPQKALIRAIGPLISGVVPFANVKDFGAEGNGSHEDLAAIQAGSDYVAGLGGGVLYFPAGHYRSTVHDGIHVGNKVRYTGDGAASFLDFDWNVFQANDFARGQFHNYTFYGASDITAGDQKVTLTTHGDAANFAAGDMLFACSTAQASTLPDFEPYFLEVGRVVSSNPITGVVVLEDEIADGWTGGVKVANVTSIVVQEPQIDNLRLKGAISQGGSPWKTNGVFKAHYHHCYIEGPGLFIANGLIRSIIEDNFCIHHIASNYVAAICEVAVGSNSSKIRRNYIGVVNDDGTDTFANHFWGFQPNEYSRRIDIEDNIVYAPGIDIEYVWIDSTGGGHSFMRNKIIARNIQWGLRHELPPPALNAALRHAPFRAIDNVINCNLIYNLISLAGLPGDPLTNVLIDGFFCDGTPGNPFGYNPIPESIRMLDDMENIDISRLRGRGGFLYTGVGSTPSKNVNLRDIYWDGPQDFAALQSNFNIEGVKRTNAAALPGRVLAQPNLDVETTVAHTPVITFDVPANTPFVVGDHFRVCAYFVQTVADISHVEIYAFGAVLATINTPATAYIAVTLEADVELVGGTFSAPTLAYLNGTVSIGDATTAISSLVNNQAYTASVDNIVELRAWTTSGGKITVQRGSIEFVPLEMGY